MSNAYEPMNQKLDVLGNSKKAKIATVALVVLLVGYGVYQAAYATFAYEYGYGRTALYNNGACTNGDGDCVDIRTCDGQTNVTACQDGFVDGWLHFCGSNLELCAKFVMSGVFPGHIDGKGGFPYVCFRTYEGTSADNILTPSAHCPPIQCVYPGCVHR